MSKIKRLAGETALYGLGSMLPKMLNFLLLPIHTQHTFTPEEYSVNVKLYAIVAFLNVLYTFGMETTYFRFATKAQADPKKVFNITQTAVVVISSIFTAIFIVFSEPISTSLEVFRPEYITWLALIMLTDAVVAIPFARLRLEHKPLVFSAGRIINVLIQLGLNLFFLKFNKAHYDPSIGIGYIFISNLVANGFYLIFMSRYLLSWRPAFNKDIFATMFKYAYPIMLMGIAGMTNEMFSRLTLEWWLPDNFYKGRSTDYALGVFGACWKFAVFMNLGVQAFRFAAEPFFFSNAMDKNSPKLFARVNHYFTIVCCIFLLAIGINLDLLKLLFIGRDYWEGLVIVPILLLAYMFLGIYYNFTIWFKLTDRTYFGTYITAAGALVTILLNYLLIPVAGYVGSSVATLLCYFFMMTGCYLLGQKYYPIPYKITSGMGYIAVTIALVYLVNSITFQDLWWGTTVRLSIVLAYAILVYRIERKSLKESV